MIIRLRYKSAPEPLWVERIHGSMSHSPALPHYILMRHALVIARQHPETPFGCVIVDAEGDIVAEGIQRQGDNPTWHCELDAINECVRSRVGGDWSKFTLYTTAEPCPMCMSAILWSGIGQVVYGTSLETLAKLGWQVIAIPAHEVVARSWNPGLNVTGGILEDECNQLLLPRSGTSSGADSAAT